MKRTTRSFITATAAIAALVLSVIGTASAAQQVLWGSQSGPAHRAAESVSAPASACTILKAGDVSWVTLDEDGNVAETVESYPAETTKVTAAFDYNCIPKKTTLITVWSIDGEAVLTDKTAFKATETKDTWTASLYQKDESVLPDGEYGIEFYIGENMLTSGTVTVGGESSNGNDTATSVTVQGTVTDSKSKKPIKGAMIIVLNEGVDAEAWLNDGTDEDVFASAKTDSKGQFVLDNPIEIGVTHAWLIGAQAYKPIIEQEVTLEEGTEDPLELSITLVKK